MDKEQFLSKITEIGACEDDVARRELLAQLQEDAGKDYDEMASLRQTNETLSTDNETLRSANMKLFLRVGEQRTQEKNPELEKDKEKREFKNLFNEKGGIK